jgi:hypothetical protein
MEKVAFHFRSLSVIKLNLRSKGATILSLFLWLRGSFQLSQRNRILCAQESYSPDNTDVGADEQHLYLLFLPETIMEDIFLEALLYNQSPFSLQSYRPWLCNYNLRHKTLPRRFLA